MIHKLSQILENSKKAYKESVLIENKILEDLLIAIISDSKQLIEKMGESTMKASSKTRDIQPRKEEDEILRVQARVPNWLKNPNQLNHKILVSFIELSHMNRFKIPISTLEKNCSLDSKVFISNYNQMKMISEKNHAKVFTEENGEISLWGPIAQFVIDEYEKWIVKK